MSDTEKDKIIKDSNEQIVLLKTHKLASALYLVTDFLGDQEPLKWLLRDKSLKIFVVANLSNRVFSHLLRPIKELIALLDIALLDQAVSRMNFNLLKTEYLTLSNLIRAEEERGLLLGGSDRDEPYLPVPNSAPNSSPKLAKADENRQEIILKFVKQKGWSGIKDIAQAVPNFSLKTVQRELASLVQKGALKREGKRRWSRYLAS